MPACLHRRSGRCGGTWVGTCGVVTRHGVQVTGERRRTLNPDVAGAEESGAGTECRDAGVIPWSLSEKAAFAITSYVL
ncbi:hypothetical protein Pme01_46460 [Planosporangium mesophilum]|uniref:Uncharacterized protein n=1 Tax=Planosporangium mesophilum TaxID=689768 RepID=A0A8J3TI12_9ACTN|nr:hypothetical protein Pme01_46460 [Planosporangium mesophilum]